MIYALMSLYILEYDKSSGRRLPAISQSASVISRRSTNVSSGSSCSKISCRVSTSAPATNVCHQYSPEILDIKYIKSNVTLFFFDLQLLPVTSIFNQPPSIHPSIHPNPKLHRRSLLSSPAPQEWPASLDPSWLVQLPMISKEFSYLFMLGITWQKNMGAGCLLAV